MTDGSKITSAGAHKWTIQSIPDMEGEEATVTVTPTIENGFLQEDNLQHLPLSNPDNMTRTGQYTPEADRDLFASDAIKFAMRKTNSAASTMTITIEFEPAAENLNFVLTDIDRNGRATDGTTYPTSQDDRVWISKINGLPPTGSPAVGDTLGTNVTGMGTQTSPWQGKPNTYNSFNWDAGGNVAVSMSGVPVFSLELKFQNVAEEAWAEAPNPWRQPATEVTGSNSINFARLEFNTTCVDPQDI